MSPSESDPECYPLPLMDNQQMGVGDILQEIPTNFHTHSFRIENKLVTWR
jgi:hypothetical protein